MKKRSTRLLLLLVILTALAGLMATAAFAADINKVEITGVTTPEVGDAAEFGWDIQSGSHVQKFSDGDGDSGFWIRSSASYSSYTDLTKDPSYVSYYESGFKNRYLTFAEDFYYTFVAWIQPEAGYTIAENATATINGQPATIFKNGDRYNVFRTFGPLEKPVLLESVSAIFVNEPVVGQYADFGWSVPAGAHYQPLPIDEAHPGVVWAESATKPSSYEDLLDADWIWSGQTLIFREGYYYTAMCNLTADTGYYFATSLKGTLNGMEGDAVWFSSSVARICYTFGPLPASTTRYTLTTGVVGGHGSILTGATSYTAGSTTTLIFAPDTGYELDKVTVNGVDTPVLSNVLNITMNENKNVVATFNRILPFTDVPDNAWFYEDLLFSYQHDIIRGTTGTTFSPDAVMTRGMMVTLLYRMEGSPAAGANPFKDVAKGSYCEASTAWAASKGIVLGYGDGNFKPNAYISREQMATMLYRYAKYKGYDTSARVSFSGFMDRGQVGNFAYEALQWCCAEEIIRGVTVHRLDPKGDATRAQAAVIFHRFCVNIAGW